MNKNGEKTKLLAVIAVFAMVACALVAFAPIANAADAVTPTEVSTAEEFEAALDDEAASIVLTKDIDIKAAFEITYDVSINLGGNEITNDTTERIFKIACGAEVSISNGDLVGVGTDDSQCVIIVTGKTTDTLGNGNGSSLTLTDVNIDATYYGVNVIGTEEQKNPSEPKSVVTLVMNDCVVSSKNAAAVTTNGTMGGEDITINNSTLTSGVVGVYAPSNGKWTITGTDITGVSGIDLRAGSMDITGGSISYTGTGTATIGSDGPVAIGVAVSALLDNAYSTQGVSITIDDSVKMNGATGTKGDVIVAPFDYSGTSVTYDNILNGTAAQIKTDVDISYAGVEISYNAEATAGASAVDVTSAGTVVTAGTTSDVSFTKDATATITQAEDSNVTIANNVKVTFTDESTVKSLILGANSGVTYDAEKNTGVTIVGSSTATVNGEKNESAEATASTFDELVAYLNAGVDKITYSGSEITDNITVQAGTTLTLNQDVTVAEGVVIENRGDFNANGKSVILNGGSYKNFGNAVSIKFADKAVANQIEVKNLAGNFTVSEGSIDIDGDFSATEDGSIIEVRQGTVVISGSLNGELTIMKHAQATGTLNVMFKDFAVNSGATLTLGTGINYTVQSDVTGEDGRFLLYGTVAPTASGQDKYGNPVYDDIEIEVVEDSTFMAYPGSMINSHVNVTGDGNIDLSQAQNPQNVGEDISADKTYGQLESVTIVNTLNIKSGVTVIVLGAFHVNEDVTLTIESGATLIIDSKVASMIVDGTIVVEEGAKLIVANAKDVDVSGAINSYGTMDITGTVTVAENGSINAYENSVISVDGGLTIEAGAALNVSGEMEIKNITNKGTVTLNGAVLMASSEIALSADGAIVDIQSVYGIKNASNVTLTVTDKNVKFPVEQTVVENKLSFGVGSLTGASGIKVTESVTGNRTDGYQNNMYVEGSVAFVDSNEYAAGATAVDPSVKMTVSGPSLIVSGELVLGTGVEMTVNGDMLVSGSITAISKTTVNGTQAPCSIQLGADGTIEVTGLIQTIDAIQPVANITAAHYTTAVSGSTPAYNYYTNFAAAIASGATQIDVYGDLVVDADITIPTGVKVSVAQNSSLQIGDETDEGRAVTVTVKDTAVINGGEVNVMGTLYFENKKNAQANPINSDVMIDGEKDRTYTNVYTALAGADAGETVTVTADRVVLTSNLTIPEGVTLDVPNSKVLALVDGVTLTVNGTLRTAETVEAVNEDDTAASVFATKAVKNDRTGEYASCIVVNGTFMSMSDVTYNYYKIPGAYYELVNSLGDYFYVTPVEAADDVAAQTEGSIVTVYGKVNAGDVSFVGTSADDTVTLAVAAGAELTASSVALTNAVMDVNGTFTGTVTVGDASVEAVKIQTMDVTSVEGMTIANANVKHVDATTGKIDASLTITAGTVAVGTITGDMTVDAGATLASQKSADSVITGILTVDGTATVANERTLEVELGVIVNGTVTVAAATDDKDAGSLVTPVMLVGLDDEFNTVSSTASVTGAVDVEIIYAVAGTTVDTAIVEDMNTTAYDVEGAVWINVYTTYDNMPINSIPRDAVPVEDAYFQYWNDADGNKIVDEYIGDEATVYADVKYDVYNIIVLANQAVDDVYIDGQIMQYGMVVPSGAGQAYYAYKLTVDAGAHTISYTLANGYSGQGVLQAVSDNITVSGLTFNVAGTPASASGIDMTLQLTGFEKTGYVPESPDTGSDSGDSGMTITDYLLIVLVVLIIVMAIIVAMRLMRS